MKEQEDSVDIQETGSRSTPLPTGWDVWHKCAVELQEKVKREGLRRHEISSVELMLKPGPHHSPSSHHPVILHQKLWFDFLSDLYKPDVPPKNKEGKDEFN